MLFRRPGADFTGLNQRRRFTQLAFVVGREERFAEPRPQRIAEEIEIANPFRIRQRLMAGSLRASRLIAVTVARLSFTTESGSLLNAASSAIPAC
jgi:hypothetical protein